MKRLPTLAAALLTCLAAQAYSVDESRWFAYFDGGLNQIPSMLLLSRAKCPAKVSKDASAWHEALEIARIPVIGNRIQEIEVPACWRRDAGGEASRLYCRIDVATNQVGNACRWIADEVFLDTRTLPRRAPAY